MIWEIEDKIRNWLNNEKLLIERTSSDTATFLFTIKNPIQKDKTLNIWQPKEKRDFINISSIIRLREYHKNMMYGLSDEERDEFLLNIKQEFIKQRLFYILIEKDGNLKSIIVRRGIYQDGLSKDRLMSEIINVVYGVFYVIILIQKEFGIPTEDISDISEEIPNKGVYHTNLIIPPESLLNPLRL